MDEYHHLKKSHIVDMHIHTEHEHRTGLKTGQSRAANDTSSSGVCRKGQASRLKRTGTRKQTST